MTSAPSLVPPSRCVTDATLDDTSCCDMPGLSAFNVAPMAWSVMSFACCISAISAGDLIMRQPAVTGVAITYCALGSR